VQEDEPCCILYTSGTTGKPKGAVLTHFGIVTNCIGSEAALELRLQESMILSVPASHVTGLLLVILLAVRVSGKIVIQRQFKAAAFLELAQRERMTYAIMVPAMYNLCLLQPGFTAFDLSSWRVGAFGGAPMPEATIDALSQCVPSLALVNIYGATETTSPAVMMPPGDLRGRTEKVGKPLPYCDIRIMDEAGRELPSGVCGEIWIAGPIIIPYYWNRPDANAADFVGGYWKSGDLGAVDADGYLSLLDRKKDMINRGGFKIYSVEVENVLMRHDAVVEAAVVPCPCPVLGERVEAFAVVNADVNPAELRALCAGLLSDYKVPDHVEIVPGPLPRNANGKLLKGEMRQWAIDRCGRDNTEEAVQR
jgi:acyl-CoA synthetase (AMP-forming)/AMP-acid ligase II